VMLSATLSQAIGSSIRPPSTACSASTECGGTGASTRATEPDSPRVLAVTATPLYPRGAGYSSATIVTWSGTSMSACRCNVTTCSPTRRSGPAGMRTSLRSTLKPVSSSLLSAQLRLMRLEETTDEARQVEETARTGVKGAAHDASSPDDGSVDSVPVHQERGEGIGLSIVKRLCELLDATIEMDSTLGEGTALRVVFPRSYGPG